MMEVKLSVSSSRRISFASDLKNYDLEMEELENERDNPTGKYQKHQHKHFTFPDIEDDDDDDNEFDYVNKYYLYHNDTRERNFLWIM